MPAPIPDAESLSGGHGFHYFKLGTQGARSNRIDKQRIDKQMISIQ